jgi:hypothetical protein
MGSQWEDIGQPYVWSDDPETALLVSADADRPFRLQSNFPRRQLESFARPHVTGNVMHAVVRLLFTVPPLAS